MRNFIKERPLNIVVLLVCIVFAISILHYLWVIVALCVVTSIFLTFAQSEVDKMIKKDKKFSKITEAFGSFGPELQETFLQFAQKMEVSSKKENDTQNNLRSTSNLYLLKNQELGILKRKVIEATVAKEIAEKAKDDAEKVYIASTQELNALKDKIS